MNRALSQWIFGVVDDTARSALMLVLAGAVVWLRRRDARVWLLVAMVGAIVLTLRHRADVRRQSISAQLARRRAETVEVVKVPLGAGSD